MADSPLIQTAAERLGVSRRTIYNMIKDGRLTTVLVPNTTTLRIPTDTIQWADAVHLAAQKVAR